MSRAVRIFLTLLAAVFTLNAAEPFFFVQLADPQLGMFNENKDFQQETANLEMAVATVNRLKPAFVVVSGDLVNKPGDIAQITEYKRIIGKVSKEIPVYAVVGNHDIGNAPSAKDIAMYTNHFGPDHYTFRHGDFVGIVLNSVIIHTPTNAPNALKEQERWLKAELKRAQESNSQHIVVFAHHPWFLKDANEPDEYFNIPGVRRTEYLNLFREAGVKNLFSGHYHQNALASDGRLEAITSGPVGRPLGQGQSGLRIVIVRDSGIEHRYYHLGELPNKVDLVGAPKP